MDAITATVVVALLMGFLALGYAVFRTAELAEDLRRIREDLDQIRRDMRSRDTVTAEPSATSAATQRRAAESTPVQSERTSPPAAEAPRTSEAVAEPPVPHEPPAAEPDAPAEETEEPDQPPEDEGTEEKRHEEKRHEEKERDRPAPTADELEAIVGTTWLLRIGLGVLAIALALFARTVAPQMSPGAKVAAAYAASMALFGVGKVFEERLERFARPVMAAGLSFGFFVAYAAHFVPGMSAIPLSASIVWMAVSMVVVVAAAERWGSEPTAILGIILGHVAAQVSAGRADGYALVMILALGATAVVLLLRHTWVRLGLLAVAASYGSHVLWAIADRDLPAGLGAFWLSAAFATSYYVIFLVADVLWWHRVRHRVEPKDAEQARLLGPVNLLAYVAVTSFLYVAAGAPIESIEWYFLTLGALQGAIAYIYWGSENEDAAVYPLFGTVLWTIGMVAALDGLALNLVLATQALLLTIAAGRTRIRVLRWLSHGMAILAFGHYVVAPWASGAIGSLLAGVAIAGTYLAKVAFEDSDDPGYPWFGHALSLAAGVVLLREGLVHMSGSPWAGPFWLAAGTVVWLAAWRLGRSALFVTLAIVGLGAIPTAASGWTIDLPGTEVLLPLGLVAWSGLALRRIEASERAHFVFGLCATGTAVFAGCVALATHAPGWSRMLVWLALPVSLWVASSAGPAVAAADEARLDAEEDGATPTMGRSALSIASGMLAVGLVASLLPTPDINPLWVGGIATVLLAVGAVRRDPTLMLGVSTVLIFGYGVTLLLLAADPLGVWMMAEAPHPLMTRLAPATILITLPLFAGRVIEGSGAPGATAQSPRAVSLFTLAILTAGLAGLGLAPLGWHFAVMAAVGLACAVAARAGASTAAGAAAVIGLAAAHGHFLAMLGSAPWLSDAFVGLVLFFAFSIAVERVAHRVVRLWEWFDGARTALHALVVATAVTGMVTTASSPWLGDSWTTAGWSLVGATLITVGFLDRAAIYRRLALVIFAVCLVRLFVVDTVGLSDAARIGAFATLGVILVGAALLYTRYTERVKNWL
ncbi:MAG: DUF2339 domain-containing protein [Gemmatimonadota bacterium]